MISKFFFSFFCLMVTSFYSFAQLTISTTTIDGTGNVVKQSYDPRLHFEYDEMEVHGLFNDKNKKIVEGKVTSFRVYNNTIWVAKKSNNSEMEGVVDFNGIVKLPFVYSIILFANDSIYAFGNEAFKDSVLKVEVFDKHFIRAKYRFSKMENYLNYISLFRSIDKFELWDVNQKKLLENDDWILAEAGEYADSYTEFYSLNVCGFIRNDNQSIYRFKNAFIDYYWNIYDAFKIKFENSYCLISSHGDTIVPPVYKSIHKGSLQLVGAESNMGYQLFTMNGKIAHENKYFDKVEELFYEACIVTSHKKIFLAYPNRLIQTDFDEAREFNSDLNFGAVRKGNKYALCNMNMELLSDLIFDDIETYNTLEIAPVKMNGKWGYINRDGKLIIPCIYDNVRGYNRINLPEVKIGNETFNIDLEGNRVN